MIDFDSVVVADAIIHEVMDSQQMTAAEAVYEILEDSSQWEDVIMHRYTVTRREARKAIDAVGDMVPAVE